MIQVWPGNLQCPERLFTLFHWLQMKKILEESQKMEIQMLVMVVLLCLGHKRQFDCSSVSDKRSPTCFLPYKLLSMLE